MALTTTRGYRPSRVHTTIIAATSGIGGLLLAWYSIAHTTPQGLLFAGVILAGITLATMVLLRRQRRILDRLDRFDRQFEHVRMTYVAEEIFRDTEQ